MPLAVTPPADRAEAGLVMVRPLEDWNVFDCKAPRETRYAEVMISERTLSRLAMPRTSVRKPESAKTVPLAVSTMAKLWPDESDISSRNPVPSAITSAATPSVVRVELALMAVASWVSELLEL